jgi:tetratricopeptide (TPR) repeat protein
VINFRYDILDKLGQGGSGEVFLVADTVRGIHVALKALHSEGAAGAEAAQTFRNEVAALLSLAHPNLVRLYDVGTIWDAEPSSLRGRRFLTMELVRGSDSLTWLSNLKQADREETVEVIMLQALSALSHVHREGVIHYDVKPQNFVLVGEQGSLPLLKLMDFGFSKKKEAEEEMTLRGTLEYTAPELLRSEPHDHRVDLYSLGATFFHLLEGRCPFEAATPVELVKHILTDELRFQTPPSRLRDVIARLLKRNPNERYPTAEETAYALVNRRPNRAALLASYFGRAQRSAFVGRHQERERIANSIASLVEGVAPAPHAFLITGIEGIGKTALLHEAAKLARASGVPVLETETIPNDIPFGSIAGVVRLISCEIQARSDDGRALFARYASALEFQSGGSLAHQRWAQDRVKYVELIARYLREASKIVPYMMLVDNAHVLDDSSLGVVRMVARDGGNVLIFAAEPGESARAILHAQHLHLRAMEQQEVCVLSDALLGASNASVAIGATLHRLYGGTPGIIVEALRSVRDVMAAETLENDDRVNEFVATLEQQLPRSFDDFVLSRFRALSREAQLIVSVLSCFRLPAPSDAVSAVLPFTAQRYADQLRFLQLEGYVGAVNNHLLLSMKRLKDVVYDSISSERKELHELIASVLERLDAADTFSHLQELAFQCAQCEQNAKAASYGEQAGDEGVRVFAFKRALELYDDAIAAASAAHEDDRVTGLKTKYTACLFRSGLYHDAVKVGTELMQRKNLSIDAQLLLLETLGTSLSRLGEIEAAQQYLTQALHLSNDERRRLKLQQELVGIEVAAGRYGIAEQACREQLAGAKRLGDTTLLSAIYNDLGIVAFHQDRFDDAANYFREALGIYEAMNEKTQVANAMNNVGNAFGGKGDFVPAIEYWERALAESKLYGTLAQQAQIHNNLGIAYFNLKQFQRAKQYYDESRAMNERMESRIGIAHALLNIGEVMAAEGEYEAARHRLSEAAELYTALDHSHGFVESALLLSHVCLRIGDLAALESYLAAAERKMNERGIATFRPRHEFLTGELFLARTDAEQAEQSYKRCMDELAHDRAKELYWLCTVRRAECRQQCGDSVQALEILKRVLCEASATNIATIVAEANYLLGMIVASQPFPGVEKPLQYFKRGIDAIAKEPVGEITWRLTFALASEYYRRGQMERAKEFLRKTQLVLNFFLSHFTSLEWKQMYLKVNDKERVLETITSITTP